MERTERQGLQRMFIVTLTLFLFFKLSSQSWSCPLTQSYILRVFTLSPQSWSCLLTQSYFLRVFKLSSQSWSCLLTQSYFLRVFYSVLSPQSLFLLFLTQSLVFYD